MGKGVIVSHLGDAHYQIGLDIDVSYARNQLTEINLYLDAFAEKYTAATDAKNTAQAALEPINTQIDDYLKSAQADSQAAYDAMETAYQTWVDAVANQPDPGAVDFLRDAMDEAKADFDQAHTDYISALDGDPEVELSPEDALVARTDALAILAQTMNEWAGGVGDLIDPVAVNDALDAVGVALDDFEAATVAYAADVGNPTLKSAMEYYRTVYDAAHDDWVGIVTENSGDALVQATRDAYDGAVETFDKARKALGALLNNGGMPEELAAIMAEQESAWAAYHAALQDWQSLTLIKADKESKKAELMSRLLPYTNNDGEPVRQTVNAWCCDFTEDLAAGAEVATIEIPGERDLGVKIRPGYESRETYSASRDGLLQPSWASSPEATYWNWALHPGNARWNPNYRVGEILFIDEEANTCTVQLDPQRNNEKSIARDGTTLDVNNPVKYQIDPDTGEQTQTLPGDNVQVADGVTTLTDVTIEYMDCNAAVFEVGDKVVVELENRDWNQPKVIGFPENPKPCNVSGIIFTANVGPSPNLLTSEQVLLKDHPTSPPTLKHPYKPRQGGNLDWKSDDGKTVITYAGPLGRSIPPAVWLDMFDYQSFVTDSGYRLVAIRGVLDSSTPQKLTPDQSTEDYQHFYVVGQRFETRIYMNGALAAVAPNHSTYGVPYCILGASVVSYAGNDGQKRFMVAAMTMPLGTTFLLPHEIYALDVRHHPETVDHVFAWAEIKKTGSITSTDWTIFHTESLSNDPSCIPTTGAYFFSASGKKFASLVPRVAGADCRFAGSDDSSIVRGTLVADINGVTMSSITVTPQNATGNFNFSGDYEYDQPPTANFPNGSENYWYIKGSNDRSASVTSAGIVAIDFIGEQEVTLTGSLTQSETLNEMIDVLYDEYGSGYNRAQTYAASIHVTGIVTDTHRSRQIGTSSVSFSNTEDLTRYWGGGSLEYEELLNQDRTTTANVRRPAYYDLRTGAAIYTVASFDESRTQVRRLFGLGGGSQVHNYDTAFDNSWTYTSTIEDSRGAEKWTFEYPFSESYHWVGEDTEPRWYDVTFHSPINDGGKYLQFSASSTNATPWTYGKYYSVSEGQPATGPAQIIGISDGISGESVGYYNGLKMLRPTEVYGLSLPRNAIGEEKAVFASGFDIDAVWQSHLQAQHPPSESQEQITQTPLEADLKPVFKA